MRYGDITKVATVLKSRFDRLSDRNIRDTIIFRNQHFTTSDGILRFCGRATASKYLFPFG